jgi:hypothetical protein
VETRLDSLPQKTWPCLADASTATVTTQLFAWLAERRGRPAGPAP